MTQSINIRPGVTINGGPGVPLMTAAGNPWSLPDGLADELVNRRVATRVVGRPVGASNLGSTVVYLLGETGVGSTVTARLADGWAATGWQWYRVTPAGAVSAIAGATSAAYVQQAADVVPGTTIYPVASGLSCAGIGLYADGVVSIQLAIVGTPASTATVGTPYGSGYAAAGGTGPYTFSVVGGTLPAGLSLNAATGTISGTPTTAGTSSGITIRVTDALGATATASAFSITVAGAGAALAISGTPATTGTVGTAYSASYTASGGTAPYTYSLSAGSLPAGLTLNASTGAISGTPTTTGTSSGITMRVTDALGATANAAAFSITIGAAALDTRPRFFVAPANAYTTGTQGYLTGATVPTGSANGGAAGTFSLTTSSGNYGWLAVLASASTTGVRVFDGVGYGGWSGAGLAGNNSGASPDPSTSSTTFTDSAGTTWRLFRQDYVNANPTAGSYTLSAA